MEKVMDIVIDTSALIAVIMNEPEKGNIIKLTAGNTLVGPNSIQWEIGNAFSAMFKKKRIGLRLAQKALSIFEVIPIRYLDVDFSHSLKLSHDNKIYAYDAYFLDCAIRHKIYLITLDGGMKTVAKKIGIKVLEV
jgi:predicted nucleic acid-binding protein